MFLSIVCWVPWSLYNWHEQPTTTPRIFFSSWFLHKKPSPHWNNASSFPEKMFSSVGFVFLSGVFLGIIAILAAEAAGLMYLVNRLNRRRDPKPVSDPSTNDPPIDFSLNKQVIDSRSNFWDNFSKVFQMFCNDREWCGFWRWMKVLRTGWRRSHKKSTRGREISWRFILFENSLGSKITSSSYQMLLLIAPLRLRFL